MSDRQTYTARAETALRQAEELILSTGDRLARYCTAADMDRIDVDRQEAGLLIQSAAVWASLAAAAPLLSPATGRAKTSPERADLIA
ncbi:hypothetical protein [Streptomyces sp. NPDC001919]